MKKNLILVLQAIIFVCLSISSYAQETTATLGGQVKDSKGALLSGVTVVVKHIPTGATTSTQTNNKGSFYVSNLQSGGPYDITFSHVGLKTEEKSDYNLSLGSNSINIKLVESTANLNEVVVKSKGSFRTGAGVQIGQNQIKNMPAINRSLQDITRLTPQSNNNSFGGTNFRYNNVTVDGAINNDAIGFSPSVGGQTAVSGQPGSSTRTSPFSLDAIQDVQVYVAPYDVKIGNFTGGSVNAVTRSGTNTFTGSIYGYGSGAFLIGPNFSGGDNSAEPSSFYNAQTGFRLGFPIIKDKLFFFTNEEITRRVDPVIQGAGTYPTLITLKQAQQIDSTMRSWGAGSAGAYGNTSIYSNSNKFFNRLDWVINQKNKLSLRNNTVFSQSTNLQRDNQDFRFGGIDYVTTNRNSSTVAELKSKISNSVSNSAVVGYSSMHDTRDPVSNVQLPQIEITAPAGTIFLGTDREASIFNMKQKALEITDNVTISKGNNTITLGTHNELYDITYGFVNAWNGRVAYASVDSFINNDPSRVRTNYNYADNTRASIMANPPAKFKVNMFSAYAEDEIRLGNLKITPGLRIDLADMPNKQPLSSKTTGAPVDANYGTTYTYTHPKDIKNNFLGKPEISPRIGFNYDVKGDQSIIIRGGTGIFTGRIPFAWLGYAYYNNGVTYGAYDKNKIVSGTSTAIVPGTNPVTAAIASNNGEANFVTQQGGSVTNANGATQVDMIDNNFKLPEAWRSSLAVDYTTQNKWKLTLEGMYTKVLEDVKFQQVNYVDNPTYWAYDTKHQQPIYSGAKINPLFTNAYLLSNTTEGYRYSLTAQVSKAFDFGLTAMVAYTFGHSKDISNGIRNSMESNWQLNPALSPNNPGLANSNFDIRNRIVSSANYRLDWGKKGKYVSNFTLFASLASGTPYTYGIIAVIDGTGQQTSLVYIPTKAEEGTFFTNATQQAAFDAYVDGNKYLSSRRGNFTERNGARTPWNNQADFRFTQDYNFLSKGKTRTLSFTFDIVNLTNLIDKNWGWVYYSPDTYNSLSPIGLKIKASSSPTTVNPTYSFTNPNTSNLPSTSGAVGHSYSIDPFASRFQMQAGLRYTF